jgi:hypothetical protein
MSSNQKVKGKEEKDNPQKITIEKNVKQQRQFEERQTRIIKVKERMSTPVYSFYTD